MGSRTIGAIHGYTQARKIPHCPHQVFNIKLFGAFPLFFNLSDLIAGGAVSILTQQLFDLILDCVREFIAAAGKKFNPVIWHRVVRGRNHDSQVDVSFRGQVGDARSGYDSDAVNVHALGS